MKETNEGILLPVKVIPKSSRNAIVGWEQGELKVKVHAAPDKGQANEALIAFLCKSWKIPRSRLSLYSGETSRHKKVLIQGYSLQSLQEIIPQEK